MLNEEKILIGGRALVALGSSRTTQDTDYLINDPSSDLFIHDGDIDYINAARHNFFKEIWAVENGNQIASPQSLLELPEWVGKELSQDAWKALEYFEII